MTGFARAISAAALSLGLVFLATGAARAEYVNISDTVTLHYQQSGKGQTTIVFVPGWTMSTRVFEHQLAHFADSETYRFITYDPRGQGRSSKTTVGHTYQQHGRDLAAFMEKLGLKDVILAGWSYGVLDEMAYLNQFGAGNLKAVILIDGTPKSSGADNTKEWVWYRLDDSDGSRQWFTMGALQDRANLNIEFGKWMLEDPTPEKLEWVDGISGETPNFVAALTNDTGAFLDYSADLKALEGKMPLLYVVRDEWKQVATDWAAANTPSAEVVGMGRHLMFWERYKEFNAVLDRFLAGLK